MMTKQQVELLGILRDFGPLTRKAIVKILRRIGLKGFHYGSYGSSSLRSVGKRLCILERLDWVECVNANSIKGQGGYFRFGYCLRSRKLWAITLFGFRMLETKEEL